MSNLAETINSAETALKVLRLLSTMQTNDLTQTVGDGMTILQILALAPHGATTKQITELEELPSENYTQAIINLLIRGGLIETTAERGQTIYKLKGGSL